MALVLSGPLSPEVRSLKGLRSQGPSPGQDRKQPLCPLTPGNTSRGCPTPVSFPQQYPLTLHAPLPRGHWGSTDSQHHGELILLGEGGSWRPITGGIDLKTQEIPEPPGRQTAVQQATSKTCDLCLPDTWPPTLPSIQTPQPSCLPSPICGHNSLFTPAHSRVPPGVSPQQGESGTQALLPGNLYSIRAWEVADKKAKTHLDVFKM